MTIDTEIDKPLARLLAKGVDVEPEVNHYFSDGVCIRELIAPAGVLLVGAAHKTNHLTTLVRGVIQIRIGNEVRLLKAPETFESLAGSRKVVLTYTECVVHNIIPTTSKDVEEIERLFTTLHEDKKEMKCQQQLQR